MAESDALSKFDFNSVTSSGVYLKFEAGKPLTLRVLTVDPVVYQSEFVDKETDEVTLSTKFAFIVYNFTDNKAQILQATPNMAKKIGELHVDPEFGSNIRKIDIRISPTGEKLMRRYDIQVLPKTREMTKEQIDEARSINLDEKMEKEHGTRMSFWDPKKTDDKTGYEKARETADALKGLDEEIAESNDAPINLEDIPF